MLPAILLRNPIAESWYAVLVAPALEALLAAARRTLRLIFPQGF
jgi:hypothetical protein